MRFYFTLFIFLIGPWASSFSYGQTTDDQIQIPHRENKVSQRDKPYVILISVDGFRADYFEQYKPAFLQKMRRKGVAAEAMIPSFPSVTFPNHYTLVTGLIPPHHGLIGNTMYDPSTQEMYSLRDPKAVQNPRWYGGMPIWSLAESQGLLSACFYWPGSEAPIGGYYPTYYYPYSETKGVVERIQRVVDWLELPEEKRPHLITFYMPQVDHAGHSFGPESIETAAAVQLVDATMKRLVNQVSKTKLPVNFIFVSDHGMVKLDTAHPLRLPSLQEDRIEQVVNNGTYVSVFVKEKSQIAQVYRTLKAEAPSTYTVYLKEEVPEKYKFSTPYDRHNRAGDIILMAEAPYYFSKTGRIPEGSHGYLPADVPEMKTVFAAWGPQIKRHRKLEAFENVHLYPLLAHLLGLEYDSDTIDGDTRLVEEVLRQP